MVVYNACQLWMLSLFVHLVAITAPQRLMVTKDYDSFSIEYMYDRGHSLELFHLRTPQTGKPAAPEPERFVDSGSTGKVVFVLYFFIA